MATAKEIRAKQRAQIKALREQNMGWMTEWYANSAGGSALKDYEAGNVVVIDVDKNHAEELAAAEAEYEKAKSAVDAQYWLFTRCAKGQPPSMELCQKRQDAYARWIDMKREHAS